MYNMKVIILFKHMRTSCIQSMYILNSKAVFLFFFYKLRIYFLIYKIIYLLHIKRETNIIRL